MPKRKKLPRSKYTSVHWVQGDVGKVSLIINTVQSIEQNPDDSLETGKKLTKWKKKKSQPKKPDSPIVSCDSGTTSQNISPEPSTKDVNSNHGSTSSRESFSPISGMVNEIKIDEGNCIESGIDCNEWEVLPTAPKSPLFYEIDASEATNTQIEQNAVCLDSENVSSCTSAIFATVTPRDNAVPVLKDDDEDEGSDSDGSDQSFLDSLFTSTVPEVTYITAQTDTFEYFDDSDCELGVIETVKFMVGKNAKTKKFAQYPSIVVAEYEGKEYRVGFLDLTPKEHNYVKLTPESDIQLQIKPTHIDIRGNILNIKRIAERKETNQNGSTEKAFKKLQLARVEFSSMDPLLVKYNKQIYFAGDKLQSEYLDLINQANKEPGTAIRLRNDRLHVDEFHQILDIHEALPKQKEICVISNAPDYDTTFLDDHRSEKFGRYLINSEPFSVIEVEPILIHSTIHDKCTEIYGEADFPFTDSERIQTLSTQKNKSQNAVPQGDKEEKKIEAQEKIEMNFEENKLKMFPMKSYAVPVEIKELSELKKIRKKHVDTTGFVDLRSKAKQSTLRSNEADYIKGYRMMIQLEECEQDQYISRFNQTDMQLTYYMDRMFYIPITDELMELAAAVDENAIERFQLKPKHRTVKKEIWGQVCRTREKKILMEIYQESFQLMLSLYRTESFDIIFKVNRVPYQCQHLVLEFIQLHQLFPKLINNPDFKSESPKGVKSKTAHRFKYEGTLLEQLNAEQKSAVENMIPKNNLPYVLFGPPGTGKTRTLVAAIEQIVRTTNQNVLVCAMSNTACDEITERLLDVLEIGELYRLYAKSFKRHKINCKNVSIQKISNYDLNYIRYPPLKYLYKFRVIICTLVSASCFTRAKVDKICKPNHFGYVIIDECASASETMSLIPIAGLCTANKQVLARIILAGDPKQLDAVTRSNKAKQLGFNISWMEQLCATNLYTRNPKTGRFNGAFITQLVKNYRSHPQILSIPNELFYENTLQACAAAKDINWYVGSKLLPSKNFPIIFKSVQGKCQQSLEHSWFNLDEVDAVMKILKQLLPPYSKAKNLRGITQSDIGICTPYRKQCWTIARKLNWLNFDEVTVGTAEVFQGKEKPIMIISTVRSDGQLGFVNEPRRLNVVITRAKSLLYVVGDPHTLNLDANWSRFLEHCLQHKSLIQSDKVFSIK